MKDAQSKPPEDLMVEQGIWPRTGGWWQCVDHGFFSSYDLVEWRHPESGAPGWQCPKCGRRDLIQWEQALIAVPAAHHEHALKAREQQVLRDVVEALGKKRARHEEKACGGGGDDAWNQGAAAACRDLADALTRQIDAEPGGQVDRDWGDGFQSLDCGATCYRYTPPDGGPPEESHGTFDGRGCAKSQVADRSPVAHDRGG